MFRKVLLFSLFAGLCQAAPTPLKTEDSSASMQLKVVRGERSKDSHVYRYSCTVEGKEVSYSGPHGPCVRGQCPHKKIRFALSTTQEQRLSAQLKAAWLPKEYTELKPTDALGLYIKAELRVPSQAVSVLVSGMSKPLKPTPASVLSAAGAAQQDHIEAIRLLLTEFARGHDSTYH